MLTLTFPLHFCMPEAVRTWFALRHWSEPEEICNIYIIHICEYQNSLASMKKGMVQFKTYELNIFFWDGDHPARKPWGKHQLRRDWLQGDGRGQLGSLLALNLRVEIPRSWMGLDGVGWG